MGRIGTELAYEVFARHEKDPALHHIGQVRAETERDALVFAYTLYDERRWEEMFVVESSAIVPLVSPE